MTNAHEYLDRAVTRLSAVLQEPPSMTQREASIHCFEFAFELGWKAIQAALKRKGIDSATPRDCLQHAWRLMWIDDEDTWLDMLRDRNITSHTYKDDVAREVYGRLAAHCDELSTLVKRLRTA